MIEPSRQERRPDGWPPHLWLEHRALQALRASPPDHESEPGFPVVRALENPSHGDVRACTFYLPFDDPETAVVVQRVWRRTLDVPALLAAHGTTSECDDPLPTVQESSGEVPAADLHRVLESLQSATLPSFLEEGGGLDGTSRELALGETPAIMLRWRGSAAEWEPFRRVLDASLAAAARVCSPRQ